MRKFFALLTLLIGVNAFVFAQTKKSDDDSNCYLKWAQKFENRAAEDVADGTYNDVIITFRSGSTATCYNGKCEVKEGKIIGMYLKKEDGSYEQIKKKLQHDFPILITNGISKTIITVDDELINVLFVKKILPKKAGFEKAADPSDD